jgi:hypothetical protein
MQGNLKGINPALAIASIINQFDAIIQPDILKEKYCLIKQSILKWEKKPHGVSAGDGEVHFTVRSDSNSNEKKKLRSSRETSAINSKGHQLECNIFDRISNKII